MCSSDLSETTGLLEFFGLQSGPTDELPLIREGLERFGGAALDELYRKIGKEPPESPAKAAKLAADGFTADPNVIETKVGFGPTILGEYSPYLLDQLIAIVAAAVLIAYILYATSPETTARFGTPYVGLTIPFPIYGIFRYLYLVHRREGGGSPADLLLADRPLLACVTLWMATVILIVYWGIPGF